VLRRKLLAILFICILLPVLVVLYESIFTVMSRKKTTMDIAGRYVQTLADYASDRWDEGTRLQIKTFLSLLADYGYDKLVSGETFSASGKPDGVDPIRRSKFIPGMVAYVTYGGKLISYSQNAAILANIYSGSMAETLGRAANNGNIVGSFNLGKKRVAYVAHISATANPGIYAIAAVTMLSWMGTNDFDMMNLAFAGTLGMLICLVGLFLLRGSVITPLQALSSQVNSIRWGTETPNLDGRGIFGKMHVDEISSLKKAIMDLARRMIDKEALEKRYVGDIIRAQEDERGRIAQDIHDGPIQVVSALIQRIQMINISQKELPGDAAFHLTTAEDVAQDLVEDLRDICDSLVPPWVSLGIVSCIEEASSRFERQHSIKVYTNVDPELNVSGEITLALFRIFQEAVSNAVRHGAADVVNVEAVKCEDGGTVEFKISDNGTGFRPEAGNATVLMQEGRRGLTGMRRRVELLEGRFDLWSEPGKGTIITVRI
jgi:signal transduction histidine kinase